MENQLSKLVSDAMRDPVKTSPKRRAALSALLDNITSPTSSIRRLCVTYLWHFASAFPDLTERAIDSVYDICEDSETDVRVAGYIAIQQLSSVDKSLVRRNTDVLVQLLQSDENTELVVIQGALRDHLEIDATASFQVMCESCVPRPSASPEENAERQHLRRLVLSFLAGFGLQQVRMAIREQPGARSALLCGLVKVIPFVDLDQVRHEILKKILFPLDKFEAESIDTVLAAVLDRGDKAVVAAQNSADVLAWLDLCWELYSKFGRPVSKVLMMCCERLELLAKLPAAAAQTVFVKLLEETLPHSRVARGTEIDHCLHAFITASPTFVKILLRAPTSNWESVSSLVDMIDTRGQLTGFVPCNDRDLTTMLRDIRKELQSDPTPFRSRDRLEKQLQQLLADRLGNASTTTAPLSFRNARYMEGSVTNNRKRKEREVDEDTLVQHVTLTSVASSATVSLASRMGLRAVGGGLTAERNEGDIGRVGKRVKAEVGGGRLLGRLTDKTEATNGMLQIKGVASKGDGVSVSLQERLGESGWLGDGQPRRRMTGRR